MTKYSKPLVRSFSGQQISETCGVLQTQYTGTVNVYGGRSAALPNDTPAIIQTAELKEYSRIISSQEVSHV